MMAAMLLSAGARIVVRSPDQLRETFRTLARQALSAARQSGAAKQKKRARSMRE